MKGQGTGKGTGPMAFRRMNHHPGRLVHRCQKLIFIENLERYFLGHRCLGRLCRRVQHDLLPLVQSIGNFRSLAIDQYIASDNLLSQKSPAEIAKAGRQKDIQTDTCILSANPPGEQFIAKR